MSNQTGREGKHVRVTGKDLHPHLKARLQQRGITLQEIERALNEGWEATDAKVGTRGKVMIFAYQAEWEGSFYEEREVTVYYKISGQSVILLTAKARYGKEFPRGEP
jgi:hypothetical protein